MKKKILAFAAAVAVFLASCSASLSASQSWEVKQPSVTKDQDLQKYMDSEKHNSDRRDHLEKTALSSPYKEKQKQFALKTLPLLHRNSEESTVISPLNLYMALSMLGECAAGETRDLLFDLLDADSVEELRTMNDLLWQAHQQYTPAVTEMVNNSLWLSDRYNFSSSLPEIMNNDYHASVYRGEMGSEKLNQQFRKWLNEKTNGLLKEQVQGQQLSPEVSAALVSALYLKAAWAEQFIPDFTAEDVFKAPAGGIETEMMHGTFYGNVYRADCWSAHDLSLNDLGKLWLYLPEEGTSLQDILCDPAAYDLAQGSETDLIKESGDVHLSVPKLDLKSERSIVKEMKELGLEQIFSEDADFSNLSEETAMCVSDIRHAAALKTDEEGLEAAAFTIIEMEEAVSVVETKQIEFRCDRPFLFILTGDDGSILMSGTVYNPVQN
ncbi:MAG: hypothetical protein IJ252_03095 [Solobacterium sp.]|nr:hypothetical protein [Solobacterium sp.]